MTEPSPSRPVPGPPRPGSRSGDPAPSPASEAAAENRFADLADRPVTEHVAAFEAEHGRLERELGTIDQL